MLIRRVLLRPLPVVLLVLGAALPAWGQQPAPRVAVEPGACYGFRFGAWSPPLDWARAGHDPVTESAKLPKAPGGRDWAAPLGGGSDHGGAARETLLLYPSWWLAGVAIDFAEQPPAPGDTVVARATALVADGRQRASAAPVQVWRVPCRPPNDDPR